MRNRGLLLFVTLLSLLFSRWLYSQSTGTSLPPIDPLGITINFHSLGPFHVKWFGFVLEIQRRENECQYPKNSDLQILRYEEYIYKKNLQTILDVMNMSTMLRSTTANCDECNHKRFLKCVYQGEVLKVALEILEEPIIKNQLFTKPEFNQEMINLYLFSLRRDLEAIGYGSN